jgi:DNA-binding IclR family transcriptional regulator
MNQSTRTAQLSPVKADAAPRGGRAKAEVASPTKSETPKKDRNVVTALVRGLRVLEVFTAPGVWLGNGEIAARTGLPKPTVSRLTDTLTSLGYLRHSSRTRQYRLGTSVLTLGYAVFGNLDVRQIARPLMQKFADQYNGLVALGGRDRFDIVHLDAYHSNTSMLTLRDSTGSRARLVNTAFGRALISAMPPNERDALLEQLAMQRPEKWAPIERELKKSFAQIEEHGFCVVKGLWSPDINAVGVPLRRPGAEPLAIGCAGDSRRLTIERTNEQVGPALVLLARQIELELQNRG